MRALPLIALAALVAAPALAQPAAPRYDEVAMVSYGGAHWLSADYERQVHPALALRGGFGLSSVGYLTPDRIGVVSVSARALGTVGGDGPAFQAGPGLTFVSGRTESAGEGRSRSIPLEVVPTLTMNARVVLSGGDAPGGGPASLPDLAVRAGLTVAYDVLSGQDRIIPSGPADDPRERMLRLRPELSVGFAF